MILSSRAIYPGGLFAIPFIPDAGLAELNITETLNMMICNIMCEDGATFSIGGRYPHEIQFAGGTKVPVLGYNCYVTTRE
jgi:hypothetical protein